MAATRIMHRGGKNERADVAKPEASFRKAHEVMNGMQQRIIPLGTRVRLKIPTIFGWRGTATMLDCGRAIKDGGKDPFFDSVDACTHEWAIMRDQTPNPEHADAVRGALHG